MNILFILCKNIIHCIIHTSDTRLIRDWNPVNPEKIGWGYGLNNITIPYLFYTIITPRIMDDKRILQEDCSEDKLGSGILTLTNQRIAFDKTKGRIADFSKKFGETVLDVPLSDITKVWKEGWIIKKVCIQDKSDNTYKFGVFNNRKWLKTINDALP